MWHLTELHQQLSESHYQPGVVVQLVRIPACHAGGRGFESRPLRQSKRASGRVFSWRIQVRGATQKRKQCGEPNGGIAQLGERLHGMQEVIGSIPFTSTNVSNVSKETVQVMTLSSRGLGHHPFTVSTGVRIPVGSPSFVALGQVALAAWRKSQPTRSGSSVG